MDSFVQALQEMSDENSMALVAFDTALQRWGAYKRFLDLAEEHWHLEPWFRFFGN